MEITTVSGGKETNPLFASQVSNSEFSEAIKGSLVKQGLLQEGGRYQLSIHIQKLKRPVVGLDMQVTSIIEYVLKDTEREEVVLDVTIMGTYTAKVGDAFLGVKRLQLANEGAAKNNIERFLNRLSELEISPSEISLKE